jgi:uncharacterized protein (DUF1697 family)
MQYVVLLRGINVGGKNQVSMADLRAALEANGCHEVKTYINSGNVFVTSSLPAGKVNDLVEQTINEMFGFAVYAITQTAAAFRKIANALPDDWTHDKTMGCNVMFLWQDIDAPDLVEQLPIKPGIDMVKYVPGAILWAFDGANRSKSGMARIVGQGPYKKMTIRNANTVRKIAALLDA